MQQPEMCRQDDLFRVEFIIIYGNEFLIILFGIKTKIINFDIVFCTAVLKIHYFRNDMSSVKQSI